MKKNIKLSSKVVAVDGISRTIGDCLSDGSFVIAPMEMELNARDLWSIIKDSNQSAHAALKALCANVIKKGEGTTIVTAITCLTRGQNKVYRCRFSALGTEKVCPIGHSYLSEIDNGRSSQKAATTRSSRQPLLQQSAVG